MTTSGAALNRTQHDAQTRPKQRRRLDLPLPERLRSLRLGERRDGAVAVAALIAAQRDEH
jgi:hypothetical protein